MENIKIADNCGLCAGCKRAINAAINAQNKYNNVVVFKDLVHNPSVKMLLQQKGIKIAQKLSELSEADTVILRAHGEPLQTYTYLTNHGIKYIDCTCPNVAQIHKKVSEFSLLGYNIVIIGKHGNSANEMHPEVAGTIGWSTTPVLVIESEADLDKIRGSKASKMYFVCQTTFNESVADKLIEQTQLICNQKQIELVVDKTICKAQHNINLSAQKLAKNSDVMIVVGGKNSSNTQELFASVSKITTVIFLEDITKWKQEFDKLNIALTPNLKIGLTAGASTLKEELVELKNLIAKHIK